MSKGIAGPLAGLVCGEVCLEDVGAVRWDEDAVAVLVEDSPAMSSAGSFVVRCVGRIELKLQVEEKGWMHQK